VSRLGVQRMSAGSACMISYNCLWQFRQIDSLGATGEKNELINILKSKSRRSWSHWRHSDRRFAVADRLVSDFRFHCKLDIWVFYVVLPETVSLLINTNMMVKETLSWTFLDWVLSHWAHFAVHRFISVYLCVFCVFLFYYCIVVVLLWAWLRKPDRIEV